MSPTYVTPQPGYDTGARSVACNPARSQARRGERLDRTASRRTLQRAGALEQRAEAELDEDLLRLEAAQRDEARHVRAGQRAGGE